MTAASTAAPHGTDARLLRGTRWRLAAWSGGSTFVVLVVLGAAVFVAEGQALESEARRTLAMRADEMTELVQGSVLLPPPPGTGVVVEAEMPGLAFLGPGSGTLALIVRPGGDVLGIEPRGGGLSLPDRDGIAAARASGTEDVRAVDLDGAPVRILSRPVIGPEGVTVVQVVQDRGPEVRALDALLRVLLVGGAAVVVVAVLLGWLYAGRALVPVRESLRRQREFAADVSHELRTPLSIVQTTVDDMVRRPDERISAASADLAEISSQTQRLTELIDELLLFARAESGAIELEMTRTDLSEAAVAAASRLDRLARDRAVRVSVEVSPAEVLGDARRLEQLAGILLDNAIRHARLDGTVLVRVRTVDGNAVLDVSDDGPGIPPEDLSRIFDRYARGRGSRPGGVGLGLAIARWLAERHGGAIRAENLASGGARFSVTLPLA
jgi:signal transduction histidine kinase